MGYDNELVAQKLRRWESYLKQFRLPEWEEIPDIGLYMEQLTELLKQYLDYLPPELKDSEVITAAAINNYVRTKIMPGPLKRRYYREHIAYLIIILTLKQSLPIAMIGRIMPAELTREEVEQVYRAFSKQHTAMARFFIEKIAQTAAPILRDEHTDGPAAERAEELIMQSAILGGFACLLAEKLILLADKPNPPEEELALYGE